MNPDGPMQAVLDFISAHAYISAGIVAAVGVMAYFKFKLLMKMITACLILGAIGYVLSFIFDLTTTGIENTEKFIGNSDATIERLRE